MPKIQKEPEKLRPYIFHGLQLYWRDGDEEAVGTCPWCGADPKFSVNINTGLWQCFICQQGAAEDKRGGNEVSFLRMLWERSFETTPPASYQDLARERRLVHPETLMAGNLALSVLSREWIVPGYDWESRVRTLYRYVSNGKRRLWMPTPTLGHWLLWMNQFDPSKQEVFLCEGLWDVAALWEVLGAAKESEGTYSITANRAASLLAEANVVGLSACNSLPESCYNVFEGKTLYLMCQNDHDKHQCAGCKKSYSRIDYSACPNCSSGEVTTVIQESASYAAMKRITGALANHGKPPAEINYLKWGEDGWTPDLKSGYDTRDYLSA